MTVRRDLMLLFGTGALVLSLGCNGAGSEEAQAVQHTFDRLDQMSGTRAGKSELLQHLTAAGLDPTIGPVTRMDARLGEVLEHMPRKPLDRFQLSLDGETMIVVEFPDTDLARWAEREDGNGFRYRNWYFHGTVTGEITRKMLAALRG